MSPNSAIPIFLAPRSMIFQTCPFCGGHVILRRKKMNPFFIALLTFGTFGIGTIVYYYLNKKTPLCYCSNCNANLKQLTAVEVKNESTKFCSLCGSVLALSSAESICHACHHKNEIRSHE